MAWPPRFCADCGAPLAGNHVGDRSQCGRCGATHYRNAKPCAGALIERGDRILLARRAVEPRLGHWDIVGGFVRPEEHPAETALREAMEETGLPIELGPLLGMYVDRYGDSPADDYTLNIYFRARSPGGIPRPASDVSELRWFAVDEIPPELAFPHEAHVLAAWAEAVASAADRGTIVGAS